MQMLYQLFLLLYVNYKFFFLKFLFKSLISYLGINVLEYAEARAFEIQNLKKTLTEAEKGFNVTGLQKLPRHMRRRAGNHDVRRIPRNLRQSAIANMVRKKTFTKENI